MIVLLICNQFTENVKEKRKRKKGEERDCEKEAITLHDTQKINNWHGCYQIKTDRKIFLMF